MLALIFYAVLFVLGQRDMPADDPLYYAEVAHRLAEHPDPAFRALYTHPWQMRIGLTVPLAILYRVLGVSPLITNLPACSPRWRSCSSSTARCLRRAPRWWRWAWPSVARSSCATPRSTSIYLVVDLPRSAVGDALGGGRDGGVVRRVSRQVDRAVEHADLGVHDGARFARARPLLCKRRYAPALALGVAYLGLCAWLWGSPLARLHGIQELTFQHGWTMHGKPAWQWLARLSWAPALTVVQMFRALLMPALAIWLVRGRDAIWSVGLVTMLGWFWVRQQQPLRLRAAAAVAAHGTAGGVVLAGGGRAGDRPDPGAAGALALSPGAGARLRGAAGRTRGPCHRRELSSIARRDRRVRRAEFAALPSPQHQLVLVCGDRWCSTLARFYFGFAPPPNLRIVEATELPSFVVPPAPGPPRVLALVHRKRDADLVEVERLVALGLPLAFSRDDVRLYEVADLAQLRRALCP